MKTSTVFEPMPGLAGRRLRFGVLVDGAEQAGMSRRLLSERFGKATGQSVTRFRQQLQVRLAGDLMAADPQLGLAAVAEQMGFSDAYDFSKVSKRLTGATPSEYRRAARP